MLRFPLLCLALLALVLPAQAQFTITAADYQALYGQTYTNADYNATATAGAEALVGAAGAGQTWDFTTFPFVLEANYTQEFIADVTGQTGAANFPDADHVIKADTSTAGEVLVYFSLRDDGVYTEGTYAEVDGNVFVQDYDPALIGFPLPMSFGSTWSGTSNYTIAGLATTQTSQGIVDGHGTLILPTGTFSVMRYKLDLSIATTIPNFGTNTTTSTLYAWFTEDGQTAATITASEIPFLGTTYSVGYSDRQASGNTGGTAPAAAPTLIAPADGATDLATNVAFTWGTVDSATSYRVQVATDPSFTSTVDDAAGLASPSYDASGLAEGTTYYWRAQGANDAGAGPWSGGFSFSTGSTVAAPSAAPTLYNPSDAAILSTQRLAQIRLEWTAVDGATGYDFQLATDAAFSALVIDESGLAAVPFPAFTPSGLSADVTYHWRSRATNAGGAGPWATAFSFTGVTGIPFRIPNLTPNQVEDQPLQPAFSWGASPGATSYRVQLWASADSGTLLLDEVVTEQTYTVPFVLDADTRYTWQARGENAVGVGEWSRAAFRTGTVAALTVAPTNLAPDGDTNSIRSVELSWEAVAGATGYDVEVATDAAFADVVASAATDAATTTQTVSDLSPATTYQWRVRATNAAGPGPWAAAEFTTALNTSLDRADVPTAYKLHSNYPNPFNPSTQIRFDLPEAAAVTIDVFDVTGRLLERVVDRTLSAGSHTATFSAAERPSGLYVYRLSTPNFTATRTMVLLK
ncbi:MAG: fibronectin type III domain-containing protein [Bacteroidota bacterium]